MDSVAGDYKYSKKSINWLDLMEQRQFSRSEQKLQVRYSTTEDFNKNIKSAWCEDIGFGGMRVAMPEQLEVGQRQNYTTTASSVLLAGTAPVEVQKIRLNGNVNTVVSWPGPIPNVTTWNITVNLNPGQPNMLTVTGYDRFGNLMTGVSDTITITQTP